MDLQPCGRPDCTPSRKPTAHMAWGSNIGEAAAAEDGAPSRWGFRRNKALHAAAAISIRGFLNMLRDHIDPHDPRPVIPLGHGDPSSFPSFRTSPDAEDAIADALRSAHHNGYAPTVGIRAARRAIADFLSRDLPSPLSPEEVYVTAGCGQSIEVVLAALATPGANILLPKPGFPFYNARAALHGLESRFFDLIPDRGWEVDLGAVEALADGNTAAMVLINPGNPCGCVYTYQHLKQVAETARKLGILVVADEVYAHLTFGSSPFISMGVFGAVVPVVTVGSLSKRWVAPGWRLGWIAAADPKGILTKIGFVEGVKDYLDISVDPVTFIQGAVPRILEKTTEGFFSKIVDVLREDADICSEMIKEIPCIACPHKPEASMFSMAKLDVAMLEDVVDDTDFCVKLSKEESVIIMPGAALGMKDWLRISFAVEPSLLRDGLLRLKSFCQRHAKEKLGSSLESPRHSH